jgi:hypothetical protein
MRFFRLLTGLGTVLVLASCYAFGLELVENSLEIQAIPSVQTHWVLEFDQALSLEVPSDWFTPMDWDTSLRWDNERPSDLRLRLRIRRVLPDSLETEARPEDVISTLEVGLGGINRRAFHASWSGKLFAEVLEPQFLPWIERLEAYQWLKERNLIVLQLALVDGLTEDTASCLVGINTAAELLFVSRLPEGNTSWRVSGKESIIETASERIDLTRWAVEPIRLMPESSSGHRVSF